MGVIMTSSQQQDICHLVARLADVLEGVVRETTGDELSLRRLDNIRHDTLKLITRPQA
jgi:hypothetical protein